MLCYLKELTRIISQSDLHIYHSRDCIALVYYLHEPLVVQFKVK
jgi:hypothetical protein